MRFILAAGGGLGPHVGGPWRCQGLGLGPGAARGRQNWLDGTPAKAEALFCWDPGIQATAKVGGGFDALWPYCIPVRHKTISNKTGKVDCHNVEGPVRTALLPRSLVAPSKEGPADIYICVFLYIYSNYVSVHEYKRTYIYIHL